jgi:hypothetical protein
MRSSAIQRYFQASNIGNPEAMLSNNYLRRMCVFKIRGSHKLRLGGGGVSPMIPNAKSKNACAEPRPTNTINMQPSIYTLDPIRIQSAGLRIARKLIGAARAREARPRMHTDVTRTDSIISLKRDEETLLVLNLNVLKGVSASRAFANFNELAVLTFVMRRSQIGSKICVFATTCFAALFMYMCARIGRRRVFTCAHTHITHEKHRSQFAAQR